MAHPRAGDIGHLARLDVEPGAREQVMIAGVVVMQMGQDDLLDGRRVEAEPNHRLAGTGQELTLARSRDRPIEAGVDHDDALVVADHPDEIGHRHRPVVGIAADEALAALAARAPVANRMDPIVRRRCLQVRGHRRTPTGDPARTRRFSTSPVATMPSAAPVPSAMAAKGVVIDDMDESRHGPGGATQDAASPREVGAAEAPLPSARSLIRSLKLWLTLTGASSRSGPCDPGIGSAEEYGTDPTITRLCGWRQGLTDVRHDRRGSDCWWRYLR